MSSRPLALLLAVLASFGSSGCTSTQVTALPPVGPAKADDCKVEVVQVRPAGALELVGFVDVIGSVGTVKMSLDEFRDHIRSHVCKVGGDVVIAADLSEARSLRGFIYRRVDGAAAAPASKAD